MIDTTVPADFTVGSVITTGGTVTAGKWNSTNTDIAVTVPLANDATLIGGTLQIQASVASGSYENLGGPHTIGGSEPNTNVTSSFSAATFEALSGVYLMENLFYLKPSLPIRRVTLRQAPKV